MRKLLLATLLALPAVSFADVKVGGFVDLTYTSQANTDDTGTAENSGLAKSGFSFKDAAIYLSGGTDKTSFMVDLDFKSATDQAWVIGGSKSQAYVQMNHGSLTYKVGQWDTIWGFEALDAKDRFFALYGIVSEQMHDSTHLGLALNYKMDALSFDFYVSNAAGRGNVAASSATHDGGHEYGLKAGWANDMLRFSAGTSMRGGADDDGNAGGTNTKMLILAGATFAGVTFDVDYVTYKNSSKVSNLGGVDQTDATGMAAHLGYSLNDKVGLGLRHETLTGNGILSKWEETNTTVGASHKCDDNFKTSLNYSMATVKKTSTSTKDGKSDTLMISSIYSF